MLVVPCVLQSSNLGGIGLFTRYAITKGTIVWELNPLIDRIFTAKGVQGLDGDAWAFLCRYSYFSKYDDSVVLCMDNARFINHSDDPKIGPIPYNDFKYGAAKALKDIQAGAEITIDYRKICRLGTGDFDGKKRNHKRN